MTLKEQVIEAIAETLWEDDVRAGECADAILSAVSAHNRAMVEESAFVEAVARATLFKSGGFTLHSGAFTSWLIDCAALTDADLSTLAFLTVSLFGAYGEVEGVPEGGLRFARELRKFTTVGPLLIADDVLTTGASMEAQRDGRKAKGVVIFARGPCPTWVTPLFSSTA